MKYTCTERITMDQAPTTRFTGWHKSSHSQPNNNSCVEVGQTTDSIGVRDTKARAAGLLAFPTHTWSSFIRRLSDDQ